jgi:hypothetical protein
MRSSPDRAYWRAALWLRRQRIRGRRGFIWRWFVPRLALPAALLATILRALTEPFRWGHAVAHLLVNVAGAGLVGGYVTGRLLWQTIVAGNRWRGNARGRGRDALRRRTERGGIVPPRSPGGTDPPA